MYLSLNYSIHFTLMGIPNKLTEAIPFYADQREKVGLNSNFNSNSNFCTHKDHYLKDNNEKMYVMPVCDTDSKFPTVCC